MFFPLCWLFDYIGVGKACIYGALTECEPVRLKCLQANAQSHKVVPLGLFHSSTRLLMTAMCLPWREDPSARPWHMPGNSNWRRVVCVKFATKTSFQRKSGGMCEEKKNTRLTPDATFENLEAILFSNQPAALRSAVFMAARTSCPDWQQEAVSATWGCWPWDAGNLGGWNSRQVHGGTALGQTD